ncbi:MAG TPA: S41 family peptidase [Gemmataceae bacterium]|nr:S41 family peptidase [Gemmataceae bacterium]
MRLALTLLALPACAGLALYAAPGPPDAARPASPGNAAAAARDKATAYAQNLDFTLAQVARHYVRPVPLPRLALTALRGLYEAAGASPPASLEGQVKRAAERNELVPLYQLTRARLGNVPALDGGQDLLASLRAVTRGLDPHSAVVVGDELRRGTGREDNYGVGLELDDRVLVGPLRVRNVLPGSPAQKAGLRPGDEITHIDGRPVQGGTPVEAMVRLNGPPAVEASLAQTVQADQGSPPVELTVVPRGEKQPRKVKVGRCGFHAETVLGWRRKDDNSWDYLLDRESKIAHVRISRLAAGTADELRDVLARLNEAGVRGLVLDLRWCPGGFLNEAVQAARLFVGDKPVATIKSREARDAGADLGGDGGEAVFRGRVVVLVNGDTAGGGELIAAALQDHGRAEVAGQRTRGKGSIQTMLALPVPASGLRLTTGTFIRPGGRNLHRFPESRPADDWGVRPQEGLELRVSPELGRRLRDWYEEQTLRPGGSARRLPLDDPKADPQRQACVEELRAKLK